MPLVRIAVEEEQGIQIVREQCGYEGLLEGECREYAVWLGKQHRE